MSELTKKEQLQAEATDLELVFEESITIPELKEMIAAHKSETLSRKTEKVNSETPKTDSERVSEAEKGDFLVYDKNGKLCLVTDDENDALEHAEGINGRYEVKK